MAVSANGYEAGNISLTSLYTVPGTDIEFRLRTGPCAEVLLYVAARFHTTVEPLTAVRDDWSWAVRTINGSHVMSNHSSGTAIDLNATWHAQGASGTFSAAQVAAVRSILADLVDPVTGECVVRWGQDYQNAPVDGMHFEVDASEDAVARVAALLPGDYGGPPATGGWWGDDTGPAVGQPYYTVVMVDSHVGAGAASTPPHVPDVEDTYRVEFEYIRSVPAGSVIAFFKVTRPAGGGPFTDEIIEMNDSVGHTSVVQIDGALLPNYCYGVGGGSEDWWYPALPEGMNQGRIEVSAWAWNPYPIPTGTILSVDYRNVAGVGQEANPGDWAMVAVAFVGFPDPGLLFDDLGNVSPSPDNRVYGHTRDRCTDLGIPWVDPDAVNPLEVPPFPYQGYGAPRLVVTGYTGTSKADPTVTRQHRLAAINGLTVTARQIGEYLDGQGDEQSMVAAYPAAEPIAWGKVYASNYDTVIYVPPEKPDDLFNPFYVPPLYQAQRIWTPEYSTRAMTRADGHARGPF